MNVIRMSLMGIMIAVLAVAAGADVIPISDVNENDAEGNPVLEDEVVTVRGVVTIGTGTLGTTNDIYVQDDTGGVNVLQPSMASPVVARGDSVEVTGVVSHATSSGRTALYITSLYPSTRIRVRNSENPLPDPIELSTREVSLHGEDYEGIYAIVSGVSLSAGYSWPACDPDDPEQDDRYTLIADDDTTCWLWVESQSDVCGSEEPLEPFEVIGVIVPDLRPAFRPGHGVLPPTRSDVRSTGAGSGFASIEPDWTYTRETIDLSFAVEADGGVLTTVAIVVPVGWEFSGDPDDVELSGPGLEGALLAAAPDVITITECSFSRGSSGVIDLIDVITPASAGTYKFTVRTAAEGQFPAAILDLPSVGVGASAESGTVLINEIYADSEDAYLVDRSEFIELYNPDSTAVDLTGWVLTDIDDSGACWGSNLWEFPEGASIEPYGYVVVAKDARRQYGQGFYYVFGDWPDYELYDLYSEDDLDWNDNDAPNLVLVSPPDNDDSVMQEIRLAGGPDGSGALVANIPAYDAVLLYSDRTLEYLIDAVEYRNPALLTADPCTGAAGLGGTGDAWTPGPPPYDMSLGRDASSTDTDDCSADLFLAPPTPWLANPASDTLAPSVESISSAGLDMALVRFSEPFDPTTAANPGNYTLGGGLSVTEARASRDGRTVLLVTTEREAGAAHSVGISGVADVAGNPMEAFSDSLRTSTSAVSISDIQEYDDGGLSILAGQDVRAVGFATVPPGVFQPDRTNMYIQDLNGWGVNVFAYGLMAEPPLEGDLMSASGEVLDYISSSSGAGATTEVAATSMSVLARGFDPLPPTRLSTGEVNNESVEGSFVVTSGVVVSVEGFAIYIDDGSGAAQVYQNFNDLDFGVFAVGDSVEIAGVVLQYDQLPPFLQGYELAPRYESDMVMLDAHYSRDADVAIEAKVLDVGAEEAIEISYNAPRASHVTVRIYDLKGREMATVYDGQCLGPQRATWDGRDDDGNRVPIGVYICHVLARDQGRGEGSSATLPIVVGTKLD